MFYVYVNLIQVILVVVGVDVDNDVEIPKDDYSENLNFKVVEQTEFIDDASFQVWFDQLF